MPNKVYKYLALTPATRSLNFKSYRNKNEEEIKLDFKKNKKCGMVESDR